ncbi:MBL fold metallo-hydrolase [Streptomyces spiramenti]|uniref:MBL fold metallo-hydrolase n=1 Tax=Streptomyces spiramenti TaxID=2720606 RepID=A0ABX1ALT9_9ACTN|nr:MBL fold metallo-hydrolase [Streptomyces spiramenti]NJP65255.1 MBL fold metallo-hydrolase [Streptomyces spiramenti]
MERTWEELAPGVVRCRLAGWDETVGAVAGDESVLMIDAGPDTATSAALLRELRALFTRPVRHLALTHLHFDHVLGAPAVLGATRYAATGARALLTPEGRSGLVSDATAHGAEGDGARRDAAALTAPDIEVDTSLTVELGGRSVVLASAGPGHTGADLVVHVPDAAVVFCGDLVEESGEPQAGPDAHPSRWAAALDGVLTLGGPSARYVPGHGAVVDAAFVRSQRDSLARRFGNDTPTGPGARQCPDTDGGA